MPAYEKIEGLREWSVSCERRVRMGVQKREKLDWQYDAAKLKP